MLIWVPDFHYSLQQAHNLRPSIIVPILRKRRRRNRQVKITWSARQTKLCIKWRPVWAQSPHSFPEHLPQDKVGTHFTNNNKDWSRVVDGKSVDLCQNSQCSLLEWFAKSSFGICLWFHPEILTHMLLWQGKTAIMRSFSWIQKLNLTAFAVIHPKFKINMKSVAFSKASHLNVNAI